MEVSRSPTSSQALLSTVQVDRKNQEQSVRRQDSQQADEARQAQQQSAQTEQRTQAASKPVVNTQGQTTGRVLNATA